MLTINVHVDQTDIRQIQAPAVPAVGDFIHLDDEREGVLVVEVTSRWWAPILDGSMRLSIGTRRGP